MTKRRLIELLIILLVLMGGIGLGWYIRSQTLNPIATIPKVIESIMGAIVQEGQKEDDDLLYYDTDLKSFILNGSTKTKVAVEGYVDKIAKQPDGDYHIVIKSQNISDSLYLIVEAIPQIKLSLPQVGDHVKIWGIVRPDILHNWWEIHPVIGWEKT